MEENKRIRDLITQLDISRSRYNEELDNLRNMYEPSILSQLAELESLLTTDNFSTII